MKDTEMNEIKQRTEGDTKESIPEYVLNVLKEKELDMLAKLAIESYFVCIPELIRVYTTEDILLVDTRNITGEEVARTIITTDVTTEKYPYIVAVALISKEPKRYILAEYTTLYINTIKEIKRDDLIVDRLVFYTFIRDTLLLLTEIVCNKILINNRYKRIVGEIEGKGE